MDKQDEQWIECKLDKEGLVTAIAQAAWCAETKSKDQKELYRDGEVKEEWADLFWGLHSAYMALTESYIKPVEHADIKEAGTHNQAGHPGQGG